MIVLTTGEGDDRSIERINIGKTLSSAKRKLKKLDEEFREALLALTKEPSVLYMTTGHGELYWKVEEEQDSQRKISLFKRGLSASKLYHQRTFYRQWIGKRSSGRCHCCCHSSAANRIL